MKDYKIKCFVSYALLFATKSDFQPESQVFWAPLSPRFCKICPFLLLLNIRYLVDI